MGTTRKVAERQLSEAKAALATRVGLLEERGLDSKAVKRDTIRRHLHARSRQIGARLRSIGEVEERNAEVERRKLAPKEEPPAKKGKEKGKEKGEAKAKGKGKDNKGSKKKKA